MAGRVITGDFILHSEVHSLHGKFPEMNCKLTNDNDINKETENKYMLLIHYIGYNIL